ncbi:Uracil DNA glycosylase, partial [Trachipleistophora hominis]
VSLIAFSVVVIPPTLLFLNKNTAARNRALMKRNLTLYNFKRKKVQQESVTVKKDACENSTPITNSKIQKCSLLNSENKNENGMCKLCNLHLFLSEKWLPYFKDEFHKEYFGKIMTMLHDESVFYPPVQKIFYFSHFFPITDTKVVIIGQDPYHNKGRATGLAFSVPPNVPMPPSLRNIMAEVRRNYKDATCNLEDWAKQGVLLLNDTLTVSEAKPGSHSTYGWSIFTDRILKFVNEKCKNVVFMLWGSFAGKKSALIDGKKHLVLTSMHPSPFSADRGFNGCNHFVKANEYLRKNGKEEISW